MRVLVDYDNVPGNVASQGPLYLADRLFEVLRPHLQDDNYIDVKLYGGWYEQDTLTRKAQDLAVKLGDFPYPLWLKDQATPRLIRVTAALAHSLESLPRKLIHSTYRQRPPARRFSCDPPADHGCTTTPCALATIVDFIKTKTCPQSGCTVTSTQIFRAVGEQKLVDTMLVADLIHLSQRGDRLIAVLSSDDDVWPGIISARVHGSHVIHIKSGSGQSDRSYDEGVPGKYTQLRF